MEQKTFEFKLTATDPEGRTIEGYAAVFGNKDLGGDVIHPGAFTKTLAERGGKVRLLWQHNPGEPLGKLLEVREDPAGLFIKAVISDTMRGRDALALLRDGAIGGMSIGYDAIPGGTDFSKDADGNSVRNLREIKLWECSLVTFPMNEQAGVTALKMVQPFGNLPLASRDRPWDDTAADRRVREWAGATDAPNDRYARAFFWHTGDGANFGDYKLGFADVVDGELTAIPRGVFAVAGVLQGARGGADIPEADQARIKGVVDRYYQKMREEFDDESLVPPWRKSTKAGRRMNGARAGMLRDIMGKLQEILDWIDYQDESAEYEEEAPAEEMADNTPRREKAGPSPATPTSARDKLLLELELEKSQ